MIMSEYMSLKTLQYQEAEFRRELERRRIVRERLAEESEVRRILREADRTTRLAGRRGIGYRLLAALSPRRGARLSLRGGAPSVSVKR